MKQHRIRSQYGVAGGLAGSLSGKLTVSGCVASVYVDGYDFAGGLVGKVVDNKGDQPARIENSYVGGHTSAGKFLVHPTPAEENFDTTQGRYNVISRDTIAGGLAAILPSGSAGGTYMMYQHPFICILMFMALYRLLLRPILK